MANNGTAKTGATHRVAELICETSFDRLPMEVADYGKRLALSAIGGMVAGVHLPASRIVLRHVQRMGGNPQAVVAGAGFRSSIENAALANGIFAHATEYEDDSMPEGVTTYTIFPSIFALAEMLRASGKQVIEAMVVGQEVQGRMGLDVRGVRRRGILNLPFSGIFGVAAASAKMLGLNVEQTEMALGIAASQAGGLVRQMGSMCHFFESGSAARDGLTAAMLAAEGFTSDPGILEGIRGIYEVATGGEVTKPENLVANWGAPYRIMEVGIKKYPCCYQEQRIIDGVLRLKRAHGLRADQVEMVEVDVNPNFVLSVRFPQPTNSNQARFSIHHSIALALMDDKINLESYTDEAAQHPSYAAFRNRVKVRVHEDWDWGFTSGSNPVTVLLKDGTKVAIECVTASGWPPDLLPWQDVVEKYRMCTEPVLGKAKVEESLCLALEMEKLDDISGLAAAILGTGQ